MVHQGRHVEALCVTSHYILIHAACDLYDDDDDDPTFPIPCLLLNLNMLLTTDDSNFRCHSILSMNIDTVVLVILHTRHTVIVGVVGVLPFIPHKRYSTV